MISLGESKMNYRDMLGFPKKKSKKVEKKISVKPTTPKITENLAKQFGPLNEWTSKPPTEKRWSGAYSSKDGLTEFERKGINEGPAYDYAKQWDNIKKTYGAFWDSIHDLEDLLQSKGMGRDAKKVNQMYKKNVEGFYKFVYKLIGKLM